MADTANLKVPSRSNSTTTSLVDNKRNCNDLNDSDQGTLDEISDQSFDDDVSEYDEITKERRVSFKVGGT